MASKMLLLYGIPVGMLATWSLVSPYFVDERVEERVNKRTAEPAPVILTEVRKPENIPDQSSIMNADLPHPDRVTTDALPQLENAAVVAAGTFSSADPLHQGIGTVTIYKTTDGQYWLRFEDFYVTDGPDLVVYLTQHRAPSSAADVTQGFTMLGQLKTHTGNQVYRIPAQVNPGAYGATVIWSESTGALFSAATLDPIKAG